MITALLVFLTFILGEAISYGITVGLLYLICLCFSLKFNILIATGVWLVIKIVKSIFKK